MYILEVPSKHAWVFRQRKLETYQIIFSTNKYEFLKFFLKQIKPDYLNWKKFSVFYTIVSLTICAQVVLSINVLPSLLPLRQHHLTVYNFRWIVQHSKNGKNSAIANDWVVAPLFAPRAKINVFEFQKTVGF